MYLRDSLVPSDILKSSNKVVKLLVTNTENNKLVMALTMGKSVASCPDNLGNPVPYIMVQDFILANIRWIRLGHSTVGENLPGCNTSQGSKVSLAYR